MSESASLREKKTGKVIFFRAMHAPKVSLVAHQTAALGIPVRIVLLTCN